MTVLVRNRELGVSPFWVSAPARIHTVLRRFLQRNTPGTAKRNVAHHYDISDDFYALFLDPDMQYSCAYFGTPDTPLGAAQVAKKAHIAAKLRLEPGMRVLDIGCGWGGMSLTLAQEYGVTVTGVTLSENQLAAGQRRVKNSGLEDRVCLQLMDYRKIEDQFDRIVSVGMLEHVGSGHFNEYFRKVYDLMAPDGVALIHTIGRSEAPRRTSEWITKYIFPGGYIPSLSELVTASELAGLCTADIECWRWHYAETLRRWREGFEAQITKVRTMYDERFVRMWRYYLVACEIAFTEQHQMVYQMQLSRQMGTVPVTRDYLYQSAIAKQ